MIVCSCNVLSDEHIRASVQGEAGAGTPGAVYRCLGCSPKCGRCLATVRSIMSEALEQAEAHCDSGCSGCPRGGSQLP